MLTNSRLRSWRACPRREYLEYDLGLSAADRSEALRFGIAFHAVLGGAPLDGLVIDPFLREALRRTLESYQEPIEIIAREVPFEIPLVNPDTGGSSTVETLGGIIDAIGRYQGRLVIVERKTTSNANEDYFARLDLDTQPLTYWQGARSLGHDVQGVVYCVVARPLERPKKATPLELRKYTKDGKLYANQREIDETPAEYGARLDIKVPIFREVGILSDALEAHQRDLWAQHQARLLARRAGLTPWRNPAACDDCQFLGCCRRSDLETTVPDGFARVNPLERYATAPGQAGALKLARS